MVSPEAFEKFQNDFAEFMRQHQEMQGQWSQVFNRMDIAKDKSPWLISLQVASPIITVLMVMVGAYIIDPLIKSVDKLEETVSYVTTAHAGYDQRFAHLSSMIEQLSPAKPRFGSDDFNKFLREEYYPWKVEIHKAIEDYLQRERARREHTRGTP